MEYVLTALSFCFDKVIERGDNIEFAYRATFNNENKNIKMAMPLLVPT